MQADPSTSRPWRAAALVATGALVLLGTTFVGAASADPGRGPKAAAVTEDDDRNDGGTPNNVPDAGDNRHPSGKDRSVEPGRSGNQGNARSDPDDDGRGPDRSNGGPDKPDGAGGVDPADQDGNNGCGNDDDFEDDNEGWCGRERPAPAAPAPAGSPPPSTSAVGAPTATAAAADEPASSPCPDDMVDTDGAGPGGCEPARTPAAGAEPPADDEPGTGTTRRGARLQTEVLGASASNPAPGGDGRVSIRSDGSPSLATAALGVAGALPVTGGPLGIAILLALIAVGTGSGLALLGRRR